MTLIDTHAHLYLENFKSDRTAVMERTIAEGVKTIYLPAINSEEHANLLEMEAKFPDNCLAMMGLHPCYVKEDYESELTLVADWLAKRPFAAVGEIGLDFYWDRSFEAAQYDAFRRQLDWSKKYRIPVSIHSRDSTEESIGVVKEQQDGSLSGIFHCFSGSYEQARKAADLGFYLGIGGVLTYKNSGLPEILQKVGLTHIVLETDAPYLTPVPFRGKRNESSYLKYVVEKLSDIFGLSPEAIAQITTENAMKVFKPTNP